MRRFPFAGSDPANRDSPGIAPIAGFLPFVVLTLAVPAFAQSSTADLSVAISDSGASVERGQDVFYRITVTDNGPADATNVVVIDTLDPATTYVSDTGGCIESPAGHLTCELGTLAAGASASFEVTAHVEQSARSAGTRENGFCLGTEDLCNRATASAAETDPVTTNNTDSEPSDVASVDLRIVVSDAGSGVNTLEDFPYTITVMNDGSGTAHAVTVVDVLDPETTHVSDSGNCTEDPSGTLACPLGTLGAGQQASFSVIVHVAPNGPTSHDHESGPCSGSEDLCNRVTASSLETDAFAGNNADDEPTDVHVNSMAADLSVSIVAAAAQVQAGAYATYRVIVRNAGPDPALSLRVLSLLARDAELVWSSVACSESPIGLLACPVEGLAAGASTNFDVVVRIDPTAPTSGVASGPACPGSEDVCIRASASSMSADPVPADNVALRAVDVTEVATSSSLSVKLADLEAEPAVAGTAITYRIDVANAGPDAASNVVVYDDLDPFTMYRSDDAGCTASTIGARTSLACPIGTIDAGASATLHVVVEVAGDAPVSSRVEDGDCSAGADICNHVAATTDSADPEVADNTAEEPTDVSAIATCGNGTIDEGEQCDPPSAEICNDGADNDLDGAGDCADPACQEGNAPSCDGNCRRTPPCTPIASASTRASDNRIRIRGRFTPTTDADPHADGFSLVLWNDRGPVFAAGLEPGQAEPGRTGGLARWRYVNPDARRATAGGSVFRAAIRQVRDKSGVLSLAFTLTAYGDLTLAGGPEVTAQVYVGDDVAFLAPGSTGSFTAP